MKNTNRYFIIAFIIGVFFLTVIPFLQKKFLKAPPPVVALPTWSLPNASGQEISSTAFKNRVWLASFVSNHCDEKCVAAQTAFLKMQEHVTDLKGSIQFVTFIDEASKPAMQPFLNKNAQTWSHLLTSQNKEPLDSMLNAFSLWAHRDAGTQLQPFYDAGAIVLVDQNGFVRGFWRDDVAGRGNSINAARLLARYGPNP